MQLTIALLQLLASGTDQGANLAKGDAFCRQARQMGADLVLFPEMWNIGYTPFCSMDIDLWRGPEQWRDSATVTSDDFKAAREQWQAQAIDQDGPFVTHFRELARELDMAIALTYLQRWTGAPRNVISLIDRYGEIILTYAKVHTCDFGPMEAALTPGDDFYVATLSTKRGEVRLGAMICYDREFPESARILMLKGAEVILTPNACELEANRLVQFRTRAYENMVGVAMANYAAPQQNGHSVAHDPIAFDTHGSRNTLIVEAGEREGIYLARFDLEHIRDYRQRESWGNAFRRPHRYGPLTSLDVEPPFVRVNAGGERYDTTKR
jgi:predicted amidohydrolase